MKINTNELLYALSRALDCVERDAIGVTSNHSKRVAYISMRLCAKFEMDSNQIYDMAACAILHDNALTEFMLTNDCKEKLTIDQLKAHCASGEENAHGFPFLGDVKNIILHHHEHWDGTGCFSISGGDISMRAAILCFADNLDLVFSLGEDMEEKLPAIIKYIDSLSGKLYSPQVAKAFLEIIDVYFCNCLNNKNIDESLCLCTPNIYQDLHHDRLIEFGQIFASIIDSKSKFTLRHSQGVAKKSGIMANFYKFTPEHCARFILAANLHDIGKLSIPNAILDKNGKLDNDEFDIIKGHVAETEFILSSMKELEDICAWACGHHEKLDGSGYHQKLEIADIPFESRLLACIDIFQALTEDRPYRDGMPMPKAFNILDDLVNSGKIDELIVEDMKTVFTSEENIKKYSAAN